MLTIAVDICFHIAPSLNKEPLSFGDTLVTQNVAEQLRGSMVHMPDYKRVIEAVPAGECKVGRIIKKLSSESNNA